MYTGFDGYSFKPLQGGCCVWSTHCVWYIYKSDQLVCIKSVVPGRPRPW